MSEAGMRVTVDDTTHPIHDNVRSLKAIFTDATGETCEVQVARLGGRLHIVIAGDVDNPVRDPRGNTLIAVYPTGENVRTK